MHDNKKKSNFFADKGLYIVLFICVAIVGIASWALLFADMGKTDELATPVSGTVENTPKDTQEKDEVLPEADDTTEEPEAEQEAVSVWQEADVIAEIETEEPSEEPEEAPTEDADFIWPLSGSIQVSYSMNDLIYNKTMADWRTHDGIDIEAQLGTKVLAVMDGTVEKVYNDDMYGTTVVIDHGNEIKSIYSSLAGTPTVNEGDTVACGDVIGSVGDTATAETNEVIHLHFAMTENGESVDPTKYLPEN